MILYHATNQKIKFPLKDKKMFLSSREFAETFIWAFGEEELSSYLYKFEVTCTDLWDYRNEEHIKILEEVLEDDYIIDKIKTSQSNYVYIETSPVIDILKSLCYDGHIAREGDYDDITYCIYRPDLHLKCKGYKQL